MTKFVVGVAGGTGAGKSELVRQVVTCLGDEAVLIQHDDYYRDLSDLTPDERAAVNFDAPEALDTDRLIADIRKLRHGEAISVPKYDFSTHTRVAGKETRVGPAPVVVVDGILALADEALRDAFDLTVYVDASADVRLSRRIRRDVAERGRNVDSVLAQYETTVRPMHDLHVEPSKAFADLIIPGEGDLDRSVEVIVAHAKRQTGGTTLR